MRTSLAWIAALTIALLSPAIAHAGPLTLAASSTHGTITLTVDGTPGASANVVEQTAQGPKAISTVVLVNGHAVLSRAVPWTCDSQQRQFTATASDDLTAPPAQAQVSTPSCATRLAVKAPSTSTQGRSVRVTVSDRWKTGAVSAKVCARSPDALTRCTPVTVPAGHASATATVRPTSPGRWTLQLTGVSTSARMKLEVHASGKLRVLATGDSMIQILDGLLAADLGSAATLRSDSHISTGITKPFMLDWPALARRQSARDRPDVTVMFLGANDGYPIGTAPCCTKAWVAAYAARQVGMMRSYLRGGQAQVYWMLLPPPRPAVFRKVFTAVNAATRIAAEQAGPGVHLVDVGNVVAPGGRFHRTIRWHGRTVSVRQADGVHLNVTGARIAAELIARRLRADGLG